METYEDIEEDLLPVLAGSELVGFVEVEPAEYEPWRSRLDGPNDRGVET